MQRDTEESPQRASCLTAPPHTEPRPRPQRYGNLQPGRTDELVILGWVVGPNLEAMRDGEGDRHGEADSSGFEAACAADCEPLRSSEAVTLRLAAQAALKPQSVLIKGSKLKGGRLAALPSLCPSILK
ncbi:hypothetical protein E1301_Tti005662 [Triplophysa tibetana]|uniref:Uncharacterized protein n=1 Tax=Triplophysa tibetana TaxID=1572043 RepID=A0A5A9NFI0_9TELE|nr:hypothetical protein E1301_Tti005662 [Triplophysa tibetana]